MCKVVLVLESLVEQVLDWTVVQLSSAFSPAGQCLLRLRHLPLVVACPTAVVDSSLTTLTKSIPHPTSLYVTCTKSTAMPVPYGTASSPCPSNGRLKSDSLTFLQSHA